MNHRAMAERNHMLLAMMVLACAGVFLRLPFLNHPLIDLDEQFYLLVGERMRQGALLYVDIWDRKPLGLFLVFEGVAGLGGDGVLQYQLIAAGCAIATATMIAVIAKPLTGTAAGVVGGIAYLIWLNLFGGKGGQAPVIYNVLTAIAAACVMRALIEQESRRLFRLGVAAMAIMGVALQLKPTTVFEGVLFGLALLFVQWRLDRQVRKLLGFAAAMIATALMPSALAFVYYVWIGHGDAFWYANAVSIFRRSAAPNAPVWSNLGYRFFILAPLGIAGAAGVLGRWKERDPRLLFVGLWSMVSIISLLAIKPYYNHYALPVLLPLSVAAAIGIARQWSWGVGLLIVGGLWLNLGGFFSDYRSDSLRARTAVSDTTATIEQHLHGGCLWVFSGPPILYHTTKACLPTPYVFPVHLNYLGEDGAIGVDSAQEVLRTLANKPAVITTYDAEQSEDRNPRTWAIVRAALARDYIEVGQHRIFAGLLHVYALRSEHPPQSYAGTIRS